MIAKGTTHNNGAKLADYLTNGKKGERAQLWQLYGFGSNDIKEAFRSVHVMAEATKCEQPFFHVQIRNREGESLTDQQWQKTAERIMRINGLTGQPYALAFHIDELTGEKHAHLAVSLIDAETLTAKRLPFFKYRLKTISRELEKEFGLEPVTNEREGPIKYAPTREQEEQARRLGVDIHAVRNTIRECWDHSDNGRSFQAALEQEGLTLAAGDRRGFVVIDHEGGIHALGKCILDVTAGQMKARLADLDREQLPTVEQAQEFARDHSGRERGHDEPKLSKAEQSFVTDLCNHYVNDRDAYRAEMPFLYETAPHIAHHVETRMRALIHAEIEKEFPAVDLSALWSDEPKPAAHTRDEQPQERQAPEPVWDRDHDNREWEEALNAAAIAKEEIEREFVEQPEVKRQPGFIRTAATAAENVIGGVLHGAEKTIDLLFSFLDPPSTPEQRAQAAQKAVDDREFFAERAQEQRSREREQAARQNRRASDRGADKTDERAAQRAADERDFFAARAHEQREREQEQTARQNRRENERER